MSQLNRSGYRFFDDERRDGTLAPFLRASLNPIAIACFRLFTVRPDPLFRVPFFRRLIADFTRFDAARPYFAMRHLGSSDCMAVPAERLVALFVSAESAGFSLRGGCDAVRKAPRLELSSHLDHRATKAQALEEPLRIFVLLRRPQHHARCAMLAQPRRGSFDERGSHAAPSAALVHDHVVDEPARLAQFLPRLRLEPGVHVADNGGLLLRHQHDDVVFVELRAEKPGVALVGVASGAMNRWESNW